VEVNPHLEITEIVTRVVKSDGPALLFENVKGSVFPIAVNILGAKRRVEWVLGVPPAELGGSLVRLAQDVPNFSFKKFFGHRPLIKRFLKSGTKKRSSAPVQEVVEEPNLDKLPFLFCWPKDGGRFGTLGLVFTESPKTKIRNVGIYRMHVYSPTTTGMHYQIQKGGGFHYFECERLGIPQEVAVVCGGDPALILSAVAPLPEGIDEVRLAGFLRQGATRMVKAKTLNLEVSAEAELVIEGICPPNERRDEGPFGDHFGHYSHPTPFPVFQAKKITRRRDAIFVASIVGKPPQEDRWMGDAVQEVLGPLIKLMHPEIEEMWSYYQAGFHNLLVVSVTNRFAKEGVKTALSLLGQGQLGLTKVAVLVSAGVNVKNFRAVLREISANFDPAEDFLLLPGVPLDTLDFTSFKMNLGSKMILDATRKAGAAPASEKPKLDWLKSVPGVEEFVLLENCLLVIKTKDDGRRLVEDLVQKLDAQVKMAAAVSADVNLQNEENLLWGIFTRFDCARDVVFTSSKLIGASPVYRGVLGIDATFKSGYPPPVEMDLDVVKKVDERWSQYQI
ncbi:MAG: UbiD family decarboxylase, partial [Limisphaerales bacterium]